MKKIILIMTLILSSCAYKVKMPIEPISFIETSPLDTTKVRYNGYYNKIEKDTLFLKYDIKYNFPKHKTSNLTVFSKNKYIYIYGGATIDNSALTCEFYKQIIEWNRLHGEKYLGNFTIKNDSIYAYSPTNINITAGRTETVYCNYRGFIKNKDTIIDWKIIPPYPKDFTKFVLNHINNQHLFKPQTLYFVKTDAVKCLQMD